MKGDFSRLTYRPRRQYTNVLLQQGRVQIDADWNEQMEIVSERFETEARDVIGGSGAPADSTGFDLRTHPALLFSQPGQNVTVESRGAFEFPGREAFTVEAWLNPDAADPTPSSTPSTTTSTQTAPSDNSTDLPILSVTNSSSSTGYWLQLEPDGRVSFNRIELRHEEVIDVDIDEIEMGDVEVIVIVIGEHELERRYRRVIYSKDRLSPGQFSRVTVAFDGRRVEMRINGRLTAARRCGRGVPSENNLMLGGRSTSAASPVFKGAIGGVRVWNGALAEHEISARETAETSRHKLILWLPFDDGDGGIAKDQSGHRHFGRLQCASGGVLPAWSRSLWVEPGRYYVEGVLVENERPVRVEPQMAEHAYVPDSEESRITTLLYLEVSEALINAIEDPDLRDVALGGADTAVRAKTVWELKLQPVHVSARAPERCDALPEWRGLQARQAHRSSMTARATRSVTANQLYRIEVHFGTLTARAVWNPSTHALLVDYWPPASAAWGVGDSVELLRRDLDGLMNSSSATVASVDSAARTLTVDRWPFNSAQASVIVRRAATFKWSRDNGAITLPVQSVDFAQGQITVPGGNDWSFTPGTWIALSDDKSINSSSPSRLYLMTEVDRSSGSTVITLRNATDCPIDGDPALHPMMRRWDQQGTAVNQGTGAISGSPGVWLDIEDGIQVRFDAGPGLRSGDYWTFPARALTGGIEWPGSPDKPSAQEPQGPERHICCLGLIRFDDLGPSLLRNYRQTFLPLTVVKREEGEFVHRTGDTMTGRLNIHAPLDVTGAFRVAERARMEGGAEISRELHVEGTARVSGELVGEGRASLEELHVAHHTDLHELRVRKHTEMAHVRVDLLEGTLADSIVGTPQIADCSVTVEKLAFPLPSGVGDHYVLRASPKEVPGYRFTGSSFLVPWPQAPTGVNLKNTRFRDIVYAAAIDPLIYLLSAEGLMSSFDPIAGTLEDRAPLTDSRRDFAFAACAGKLYVVGGRESGSNPPTLIYDPASDQWISGAPLGFDRYLVQAVAQGASLHALGGKRRHWWGPHWSHDHEVYDPYADAWRNRRRLRRRYEQFAAAELDGDIYVTGGKAPLPSGHIRVRECDVYDPGSNNWERRDSLPRPMSGHSACGFAGRVFAVGVVSREALHRRTSAGGHCSEFRPEHNLWAASQPARVPAHGVTLVPVGNTLYAVNRSFADQDRALPEASRFIWPVTTAWYVFRPTPPSGRDQPATTL